MTDNTLSIRARIALALIVVASASWLVVANLPGAQAAPPINDALQDGDLEDRVGEQVAAPPPTDDPVVISSQGHAAKHYDATVVAINQQGTLMYADTRHDVYFDVDPIATGKYDVQYIGVTDHRDEDCPTGEKCTNNHIIRANLSTGERETLYSEITPNHYESRWHDAQRVDERHYLVAGLEHDRLLLVDVQADETVWEWHFNESAHFESPAESGGGPDDWTHVNDVELLEDGRIMVSPRNHDQVTFLEVASAGNLTSPNATLRVDEEWTLGADGRHSVLFEQHNPDYIPPEQGGPAVIVADSENDRLMEYQRHPNGSWTSTWMWRDDQTNWPRDADRLPDGDTLITDSRGDRVLLVDPDGEVEWNVSIGIPYEAEVIGAGPESTGGPAASSDAFTSRADSKGFFQRLLPAKLYHGASAVLPRGVGVADVLATLVLWTAGGVLVQDVVRRRRNTPDETAGKAG